MTLSGIPALSVRSPSFLVLMCKVYLNVAAIACQCCTATMMANVTNTATAIGNTW